MDQRGIAAKSLLKPVCGKTPTRENHGTEHPRRCPELVIQGLIGAASLADQSAKLLVPIEFSPGKAICPGKAEPIGVGAVVEKPAGHLQTPAPAGDVERIGNLSFGGRRRRRSALIGWCIPA